MFAADVAAAGAVGLDAAAAAAAAESALEGRRLKGREWSQLQTLWCVPKPGARAMPGAGGSGQLAVRHLPRECDQADFVRFSWCALKAEDGNSSLN